MDSVQRLQEINPKFLCFLVSSPGNTNDQQRATQKSSISIVSCVSALLRALQSDPKKGEHVGRLELQTGWQWAKVSSCPHRTTNMHSLFFPLPTSTRFLLYFSIPWLCRPFGLWLSLGRASPSLGVLAGGALGLGGWGGPRVASWRKQYATKHRSNTIDNIELKSGFASFAQPVINLLPRGKNNENSEEGTTTSWS